tara:strand:+ start:553 stop:960 length:408 start_codon:yes stop_codon:yes gene_type:complete
MKKFIFACILGALTYGMHAQELTAAGQSILSSNYPISIKGAIDMSQYQAPLAALHFRDAKKARTWNFVWAFLGGWEVGAGAFNVANGYSIGAVDLGIGAGLCAISFSGKRKARIVNSIRAGVEEYNKSLQIKEAQ